MQNTLASYQNEIDRLKETTEDLRQDMESCREREAELLNFTEKLTAKNVTLQSEYAILEAKVNIIYCFKYNIFHISFTIFTMFYK